jgi:hypothetical protein
MLILGGHGEGCDESASLIAKGRDLVIKGSRFVQCRVASKRTPA